MSLLRDGVLQRNSDRTWQRDVTLGANTLTIPSGHSIDALRFVAGELQQVAAVQLHRFIDAIERASVQGQQVNVPQTTA